MPYKCVKGGVTRPCIYDPHYDTNLSEEGKRLQKKKYRSAKKGDEFPFVCPISRKYFEATDEATKRQDERDLAAISAKLKGLGKKIPEDLKVWEAAINLAILEQVERKKKERKPTRILEDVDTAQEDEEPTNRQLKEQLDGAGINYPPNANKAKLKELLAGGDSNP